GPGQGGAQRLVALRAVAMGGDVAHRPALEEPGPAIHPHRRRDAAADVLGAAQHQDAARFLQRSDHVTMAYAAAPTPSTARARRIERAPSSRASRPKNAMSSTK